MQFKTLLLGLIFSIFSVSTMAGSGHDHGHGHSHGNTPVNQEKAVINATEVVSGFVTKNKLDKSWGFIKASSVEKNVFKGNSEWVIIFINDKIAAPDKQKLYVFLTLSGDYVAANYTGK